MNYKKLIVESGVRMIDGGYTVSTWGNISVRDPETQLVYITPSGMDYSTLTEDDIVVLNIDGEVVDGERTPSIESGLHLACYRARKEVNAVIHTHPIHSTVFSCMGKCIPLMIDEAAQILGDTCLVTEYALPGTQELADNCAKALGQNSNSCLLRSHGAVCIAEDMDTVFNEVKVLEHTAQIYQMILATGGDFDPISDENIKAMQYYKKNVYGQRK